MLTAWRDALSRSDTGSSLRNGVRPSNTRSRLYLLIGSWKRSSLILTNGFARKLVRRGNFVTASSDLAHANLELGLSLLRRLMKLLELAFPIRALNLLFLFFKHTVLSLGLLNDVLK